MKPYYQDDAVTIYHGDCREILPYISADVLVTDPPYGTGHYETDRYILTPGMLFEYVERMPSAVFGWPEKLVALCVEAGVKPSEWITYWPTNGALRGTNPSGLWRESECVAVFGKHRFGEIRQRRNASSRRIQAADYIGDNGGRESLGQGLIETRHFGDVWTDHSPGLGFQAHLRVHPNEKSMHVMRRLVDGMAAAGTTLDPFAGSGTTLRAAKDLGRKAIGIEIEEKYCEIAARRCSQEVLL